MLPFECGKGLAVGGAEAIGADHINPKLTITDIIGSGDTVMAFGRYEATIRATGRHADTPIAHMWKLRDGKVVRYDGLLNTYAVADAAMQRAQTA